MINKITATIIDYGKQNLIDCILFISTTIYLFSLHDLNKELIILEGQPFKILSYNNNVPILYFLIAIFLYYLYTTRIIANFSNLNSYGDLVFFVNIILIIVFMVLIFIFISVPILKAILGIGALVFLKISTSS